MIWTDKDKEINFGQEKIIKNNNINKKVINNYFKKPQINNSISKTYRESQNEIKNNLNLESNDSPISLKTYNYLFGKRHKELFDLKFKENKTNSKNKFNYNSPYKKRNNIFNNILNKKLLSLNSNIINKYNKILLIKSNK